MTKILIGVSILIFIVWVIYELQHSKEVNPDDDGF